MCKKDSINLGYCLFAFVFSSCVSHSCAIDILKNQLKYLKPKSDICFFQNTISHIFCLVYSDSSKMFKAQFSRAFQIDNFF